MEANRKDFKQVLALVYLTTKHVTYMVYAQLRKVTPILPSTKM